MIVRVTNLTKSFGGNVVFEDVNFEIKRGDRVALVGENGSGKSTLFRIISGELSCDSGAVITASGVSIGYLEQEPRAKDNETVFEAALDAIPEIRMMQERLHSLEERISSPEFHSDSSTLEQLLNEYEKVQVQFEHAEGYSYEDKVQSILKGLGFTDAQLSRPLHTLSGGEKKLVGLAQLLIQQPDLILLDEPDNHLDMQAKQWLEEYIRSHNGAVGIISHDRYFLDRFINRIFELEDHRIYEYHCNYSGFREAKQRRLEKEAMLYELRKRELKELKKSAERLARWAAMNNKFAGRAKNRKRLLEQRRRELESKPRPIVDRATIELDFRPEESSRSVLEIGNLSMSYGDHLLFAPFSLTIRYGEQIGLVGPNGSGKTTLFKLILGEESPTTGSIKLGPRVKVGYYSQEQESLDFSLTPIEYIRRVQPMREEQAIAFLRGRLLFDYEVCFTQIGTLSGGQKSRLQLAAMTLSGVNFLLLDEPTNNLDIPSMIVLEDALIDFEGTILTISHDRYFLDQIVDRIIAIEEGVIRDYPGTFTDFYEKVGGKIDIGMAKPWRLT